MKFSTKAIVTSLLATIVVAGQAVANSDTQAAPTWQSYHSSISKYPLYGNKKTTTTTTTTTTNTAIDASRKAIGSFNPTTEIVTNRQKVATSKYINNGDDLAASSSANLIGPKQSAYQDGLFSIDIGNGGGVSKDSGGLFNRNEDNRIASINVSQALSTGGNNGGIMENESQVFVNFDGEQVVDGVSRSAIGNDFGNKQTLLTGDQTSLQQHDVSKNGDATAIASDTTTSNASNTSP
jgi:hypothetical protein